MPQEVILPESPGAHGSRAGAWDPPWADQPNHPEYYRSVTLRRIVAYILDAVIVTLMVCVVWWVSILINLMSFGVLSPLIGLFLFFMPVIYHTAMVGGPRASTLGMRAMGIRVMSVYPSDNFRQGRPEIKQALAQVAVFYISVTLTSFLVLLVPLFNPRRRTVHDWMSGTVIVREDPFNI